MTWDKEKAATDLREWPIGSIINWSDFAGQHSIPGRNGGQVAKEFAKETGIDVFSLDQTQGQGLANCGCREGQFLFQHIQQYNSTTSTGRL